MQIPTLSPHNVYFCTCDFSNSRYKGLTAENINHHTIIHHRTAKRWQSQLDLSCLPFKNRYGRILARGCHMGSCSLDEFCGCLPFLSGTCTLGMRCRETFDFCKRPVPVSTMSLANQIQNPSGCTSYAPIWPLTTCKSLDIVFPLTNVPQLRRKLLQSISYAYTAGQHRRFVNPHGLLRYIGPDP